MSGSSWSVYILHCSDDSLYTGVTTDLPRRLHEHNHSRRGARYTRARRPVRLFYQEQCSDRAEACRREWQIRQLSRRQKLTLGRSQADDSMVE